MQHDRERRKNAYMSAPAQPTSFLPARPARRGWVAAAVAALATSGDCCTIVAFSVFRHSRSSLTELGEKVHVIAFRVDDVMPTIDAASIGDKHCKLNACQCPIYFDLKSAEQIFVVNSMLTISDP